MGFSHDNQVVNSVTTAMSKVQISEPQTKTDCVYSRMEVAKMGRRLGKTQEMPQILKCAIRLNEVGFIPSDTYDAWGRWVERQALCKPGYPVPGTPWGPPLPQAKPQNGFGSSSRSSSYASSSSRPKINGSGHFGQGDVLEVPVVQDPVAHQASVIAMDPAPIVHVAPPHVVHQAPVVHEAPAPPPVAQGPVIHLVPTPNVAPEPIIEAPKPVINYVPRNQLPECDQARLNDVEFAETDPEALARANNLYDWWKIEETSAEMLQDAKKIKRVASCLHHLEEMAKFYKMPVKFQVSV